MDNKELFDKIIQHHTSKENFLHPFKEEGYEREFIDKVDRKLNQIYGDYDYVKFIDNHGFMYPRKQYRYLVEFCVPVSETESVTGSVTFYVPDDLTIRKMKIDRIMNSDFSKKQFYKN
jgi:hypothetical protein